MSIRSLIIGTAAMSIALPCVGFADAPLADELTGSPAADSHWPRLLGEQYTFVLQNQSSLHSPYAGPLSLKADGDTQPTHTFGFYFGWAPLTGRSCTSTPRSSWVPASAVRPDLGD
jgi:hypothetical protein